jgi:hypothetical protein
MENLPQNSAETRSESVNPPKVTLGSGFPSARAVKTRNLAIDLTLLSFLFEGVALVGLVLARTHPDFHLHPVALPVKAQGNESVPLDVGLLKEPGNLLPMEQKPATAFGVVLGVTGLFVGADFHVIQEDLPVFDPCKRSLQIGVPLPNAFHLGSPKFQPSFETFQNMEISKRFAVYRNFGAHTPPKVQDAQLERPSPFILADSNILNVALVASALLIKIPEQSDEFLGTWY